LDGVISTVIYPIIFGVRQPAYQDVIEHLHKHNPGHTVDLLDPQTPMLLPHCLCGEKEFIYLEERATEESISYRYKCGSCSVHTDWSPSRGHAMQLWKELQTK
jgi:hypothetical protein